MSRVHVLLTAIYPDDFNIGRQWSNMISQNKDISWHELYERWLITNTDPGVFFDAEEDRTYFILMRS